MVWEIIIGAVVGYAVFMFLMHEIFKKFFHTILFVSFIALALAMIYLTFK